ncbi:unnamed protein product [Cylindrotheca closterium]|uniref:RING finger and CHY zinc finger domain-containing protein 1 n=1 Tax=Cylindrotheca closterium TaxID=2856 RepID=A0AAD2CGR4_9STRA|nr:unnamed protein product [Cylindrotheca closterium]
MAGEDEHMQDDIDAGWFILNIDGDDEDLDEDEDMQDDIEDLNEDVEKDYLIARRVTIQAIMRNDSISDQDKRLQIQAIMRAVGATPSPSPVLPENKSPCVHYERNCNIIAPCCRHVYGCRICHDESNLASHPIMNQFLVCKLCNIKQQISNQCISCKAIFGKYHCSTCNLWMSQSKKPFHCTKCGCCRVGGADAFRHCDECCTCISIGVYADHQCSKDKYKKKCPVCEDDMLSPPQSPQDLPCGHTIHAHCFRKLAGFDYRCPICEKPVVSTKQLIVHWDSRVRDIAEHPMPADLQRVIDMMCNDCETKSYGLNWHFLGIQCPKCNSFNTAVEQVLSSGE